MYSYFSPIKCYNVFFIFYTSSRQAIALFSQLGYTFYVFIKPIIVSSHCYMCRREEGVSNVVISSGL